MSMHTNLELIMCLYSYVWVYAFVHINFEFLCLSNVVLDIFVLTNISIFSTWMRSKFEEHGRHKGFLGYQRPYGFGNNSI